MQRIASRRALQEATVEQIAAFSPVASAGARRARRGPESRRACSLLVGPGPPLDPPLGGDRINNPLITLGENERDRPPDEGVAAVDQSLRVLTDALIDRPACDAGIVAAVGAFKDGDRRSVQCEPL